MRHLSARLVVEHTNRAHCLPVEHDRRTGIEAQKWRPLDLSVTREPRIGRSVEHDEAGVGRSGHMRAKRVFGWGTGLIGADSRLEPLPFAVDQRHQCDLSVEKPGSNFDDPVEIPIRDGHVGDGRMQNAKTLGRVEQLRHGRVRFLCPHVHTVSILNLNEMRKPWRSTRIPLDSGASRPKIVITAHSSVDASRHGVSPLGSSRQ
ncbi:hypothetical protein D9M68_287170 [compost metagenome]